MSHFQISMRALALATLAAAVGVAGAPATLSSGPAIEAVSPDGGRASSIAQSRDGEFRVAIQWSGSNGGDDTPTEDHPF
jgi:hypothetical protein